MKQLFFICILLLGSCQNETKSSAGESQENVDKKNKDISSNNHVPINEKAVKQKNETASNPVKSLPEGNQNIKSTEFLCQVRITVKEKDPYCGGVETSFERRNRYVPVSDKFVLINQKTLEKISMSSINGMLDLNLKPAKYQLFEGFKDVSKQLFFEEQSRKYDSKMYTFLGTDCFEKWQKTPLLTFEVKSNKKLTLLEAKIEKYCFVDANPCIKYHGSLPQ